MMQTDKIEKTENVREGTATGGKEEEILSETELD